MMIAIIAIAAFAGCNSFGSNNWKSTNCYNNGTSQHWNSYKAGNFTNTTYSNSNGVYGNTNQFNYGNGNFNRTLFVLFLVGNVGMNHSGKNLLNG